MKCTCDFCSGTKRREDNWCSRCGEIQMPAPKSWENLDVCDACEQYMLHGETRAEIERVK
jgi:hypothetical protein